MKIIAYLLLNIKKMTVLIGFITIALCLLIIGTGTRTEEVLIGLVLGFSLVVVNWRNKNCKKD